MSERHTISVGIDLGVRMLTDAERAFDPFLSPIIRRDAIVPSGLAIRDGQFVFDDAENTIRRVRRTIEHDE